MPYLRKSRKSPEKCQPTPKSQEPISYNGEEFSSFPSQKKLRRDAVNTYNFILVIQIPKRHTYSVYVKGLPRSNRLRCRKANASKLYVVPTVNASLPIGDRFSKFSVNANRSRTKDIFWRGKISKYNRIQDTLVHQFLFHAPPYLIRHSFSENSFPIRKRSSDHRMI